MDLFGWQVPGQPYLEVCDACVDNESNFQSFKQNPQFNGILEHASKENGDRYIQFISELSSFENDIVPSLDAWRRNDENGGTVKYEYPLYGTFSPTTLSYIYNYYRMKQYIPEIDTLKNIVEIGGGYGGQCYVISQKVKFNSYTIFDLKEVTRLQSKYLKRLDIDNVQCLYPETFSEFQDKTIDLIISTFAWSELSRNVQLYYFMNYISKAKHGFFRCNLCYSGLTRDELITLFQGAGFSNLHVGQDEMCPPDNSTVVFYW
jgi:putative sugar O-methyltransferase